MFVNLYCGFLYNLRFNLVGEVLVDELIGLR